MPSSPLLFSPSGAVIRTDRTVEALHPRETIVLVVLHKIAQRLGIGIHCSKCGKDFKGMNAGHEKYFSVTCECRELRGDAPQGIA